MGDLWGFMEDLQWIYRGFIGVQGIYRGFVGDLWGFMEDLWRIYDLSIKHGYLPT